MSYFAKIENGIVVQVISAEQSFIDTQEGLWKQTSYNTHNGIHYGPNGQPDGGVALRANYAGIGFIYDSVNDVFYQPQPYPSWTNSAPTWEWQPPVPRPNNGNVYVWNEPTLTWIEIPT